MNVGSTELLILLVVALASIVPIVLVIWLVTRTARSTPASQPLPAGSYPDGWYPDPTGRHQERWFRAGSWSAQVRDGGAAGPVQDDPI